MRFAVEGRGIEFAGARIGQQVYCLLMQALLTDSLLSNGGAVARGCGSVFVSGQVKAWSPWWYESPRTPSLQLNHDKPTPSSPPSTPPPPYPDLGVEKFM